MYFSEGGSSTGHVWDGNSDINQISSFPTTSHINTDKNFSFASYYADYMVLQGSPKKAVIWGYAPPTSEGATVTLLISPGNVTYTTQVTENLVWSLKIGK